LLARVFGVVEALSMAALLIGSLLVTALVALGGLSLALVGIGLVLPLVVLAFGRSLFDVDRDATVPVVEIGLLRSLPLFAPLPAPQLEAVARSLQRTEVSRGTCVALRRDDFLAAVTSHPRADDQARRLASARLLELEASDARPRAG
jgi:hypothetical protein